MVLWSGGALYKRTANLFLLPGTHKIKAVSRHFVIIAIVSFHIQSSGVQSQNNNCVIIQLLMDRTIYAYISSKHGKWVAECVCVTPCNGLTFHSEYIQAWCPVFLGMTPNPPQHSTGWMNEYWSWFSLHYSSLVYKELLGKCTIAISVTVLYSDKIFLLN